MMDILFSDHSLIQQPQKRLSLGSNKWLRLATFVCMDITLQHILSFLLFMSRFYVAHKVSFLSGFVITLHCLISLSQRPYFSKINFIPNLQSEININNLLPMQCMHYECCVPVSILSITYQHITTFSRDRFTLALNTGHRSTVALPSCRYS